FHAADDAVAVDHVVVRGEVLAVGKLDADGHAAAAGLAQHPDAGQGGRSDHNQQHSAKGNTRNSHGGMVAASRVRRRGRPMWRPGAGTWARPYGCRYRRASMRIRRLRAMRWTSDSSQGRRVAITSERLGRAIIAAHLKNATMPSASTASVIQ